MNHPREYVAFIHTDDDELPGGRFPSYRDEWLAPDWTLGQCVGWIHGRTPAWGRRFAPEYLRRKAPSPLAPVSQADARNYLRRAASEDRQLDLQHHLWSELFYKLAAGDIIARGKKSARDIESDIPQGLWGEGTVDHNDMHGGTYDDVGKMDGVTAYSVVEYHSVRVRRADALRAWPAPKLGQSLDEAPQVSVPHCPMLDSEVCEPLPSTILSNEKGQKPEADAEAAPVESATTITANWGRWNLSHSRDDGTRKSDRELAIISWIQQSYQGKPHGTNLQRIANLCWSELGFPNVKAASKREAVKRAILPKRQK